MAIQHRLETFIAMDVNIRSAQFDDLDALEALLRVLFSIEADFDVDPERQRRGLSLMLDGCGKHRCVMVSEVNGRVVGMCTAQTLVSTAEGGLAAMIEDMVVDPDYQGMGIGRRLMTAVEEWTAKHDVARLQLLADRKNPSALKFYGKIGWRPTQLVCLRKKKITE